MSKYHKLILACCLALMLANQVGGAQREHTLRNAFLLSLLLPGAGEYYLGYPKYGTFLVALESGLWLGMVGFNYYGTWKQEDAVAFAAEHAGIDSKATAGDEDFYRDVGDYASMESYNLNQTLNGNTDEMYSTADGYAWSWEDQDHRTEYARLRRSSFLSYRRAYYMGGGLLLNRLVSVLNTIRLVRTERKVLEIKGAWHVQPGPDACGLVYTRRF